VQILAPGEIVRSPGETIIEASWGSDRGQFGLKEGTPLEGPTVLALDASCSRFAVLDEANARVCLFDISERSLLTTIPIPERPGVMLDMVLDAENAYILLNGREPGVFELSLAAASPQGFYPIDSSIEPQRIYFSGEDVWVWGEEDRSYTVRTNAAWLGPREQLAASVHGFRSGAETIRATRVDKSTVQALREADGASVAALVTSDTFPVDSAHVLGEGIQGQMVLAMRIWGPEWTGTEAWCFLGVGRDGNRAGQLLLPLDYYAGGSFKLGSDGSVYELRTTEEGATVARFSLLGGGQ